MPGEAAVDLVFVAEPPRELLGRRSERQQVREDAARRFGEERVLLVPVGKERRGERERFGVVPQLVGGVQYGLRASSGFRIASPRSG